MCVRVFSPPGNAWPWTDESDGLLRCCKDIIVGSFTYTYVLGDKLRGISLGDFSWYVVRNKTVF